MSRSEIGLLGRKFIGYLAVAHEQAAGRIQEAMALNGGYVLHLDGTFDGQGPMLVSGLDSLSRIVLANVKRPSEKAEGIIPFLRDIQRAFGDPLALVHDMGAGILAAVGEVFPDRPDFICHYHFLRDLGIDLFGRENDWIRKHLRAHAITTKLRRHGRELKRIVQDNPLCVDSFCHAMDTAVAPDTSTVAIRAIGAYSLIQWILDGKNQGGGYCRRLRRSGKPAVDKRYRKLLDQIDKYQDKLFCDPLIVHTSAGTITVQPQRTNNIMERFFRTLQRAWRRKTGNRSLGKSLQTMIADTPLVHNLGNPHYLDLLLADQATLQERFAQIDIHTVRRELKNSQNTPEKIPPKIKKLITRPEFADNLARILYPFPQAA